ncbi:hypothetical protein BEP19_15920 [Ammoniphilus oxalaticus]|uniref:Terminase n=1 Tax=Ammoniphilus oxalaticus TaxID=66863 RepID=A0A419SQD1_9BACL|nr:terminase TerL endonuclease subunit [Ammoniphilus oxalaticus]RKD26694.1 hypothetical protein BEP19_15920 [Ammoniphilus oxalaticus]
MSNEKLKELINKEYLTDEYYFDEEEAQKFKRFYSKLWLPDNPEGTLVELLMFQLLIAIEILAIKRVRDGTRRFREVFITMPRKNAKSFLVALIMLYIFFTDKQRGQQNIIVANSRDQAANVFEMIKYMVENNPTLMKHCRIVDSRRTIYRRKGGSYIRVMSSDAGRLDSFKPYVALVDETHEDTTRGESFTKLQTGMGQWDEPLIFSVTTASDGQNKHNLEYEKYEYALKVRSGEVKDDAFYSAIFRADDDCDLMDQEQWIKSNPGIDLLPGGFRKSEEIERFARQAVLNPVKEPEFRRYYLNQHVVLVSERAINQEYWKMAVVDDLSFLKGKPCYAGLDLSINKDFSAFVMVFPIEDQYYVIPYLFKPKDTLAEDGKTDDFPYVTYAKQGFIEATEGDYVNYRHVRHKINELARIYDIKEIAFDMFASSGIASDLQNDGFVMVDHIQGFGFSPTISDFYDLLFDKRIKHNNNPVMNWMSENTFAEENSTGKLRFDKRKGKIDGIIAMLMGLTRAMANNKKNEYDPNKAVEDWAANT